MDRNTVIALVLSALVLIGWGYLTKPTPEQIERAKQIRDSLENIKAEQERQRVKEIEINNSNPILASDATVADKAFEAKLGDFSSRLTGENEFYTIENSLLSIVISKKGGRPYSIRLKEFKTYDSLPLYLFKGDTTVFGLTFNANNSSTPINTNNLFWEKVAEEKSDSSQTLKMRLPVSETQYIEYSYTLYNDKYHLDFNIDMVNMGQIVRSNYFNFDWSYWVPSSEKSLKWEQQRSAVYYKYSAGDVEYLGETSDEQKKLTEKIRWVAFKSQFFSSIIRSNDGFNEIVLKARKVPDPGFVKEFAMTAAIPYGGEPNESHKFTMFFGPNKYYLLDSYGEDYQRIIPLGWGIFRWVNRYIVIFLFNFLNSFISNYGIIILLLTIIIKVLIFPLTYKSYLSTAKMKVLKPEIDELNEKYPNKEDAVKKQQAMMDLYKRAGVSPMGGCLPTLLQLPILIAMFSFFPSSFELRQQPFLWADDLSSYDAIFHLPFNIPFYGSHVSLFCLLMVITNIVYIKLSDQTSMSSSTMPGMKTMMYMMPIMMLFIFNDYASGLSYYYLLSLLITILQTVLFRQMVDEKALHAQIQANKLKPVKKSAFQKRLEEAARQRNSYNKKRR
ncbi:MAG TPA: membrane protein insertase YidC [Salinivirgaceae bacterium]|nr:membrane protein insertase YidC [Salinivirgaceae bacterium]